MMAQRRDDAAASQRRQAATCNPRPLGSEGLAIPPHRAGCHRWRTTSVRPAPGLVAYELLNSSVIPETGSLDAIARVPASAGRAAARAPRSVLAHGEDHCLLQGAPGLGN